MPEDRRRGSAWRSGAELLSENRGPEACDLSGADDARARGPRDPRDERVHAAAAPDAAPADQVLVSWSGGKDSCLALEAIRRTRRVAALLTTITREFDRISMHGVRSVLLERQAESLGLPLHKVFISKGAGNE